MNHTENTATTITDDELESLEAMMADTTPGLHQARSKVALGVISELLAEVRAARRRNVTPPARRTTVLTYSGKLVDLYQPDPATIDFADIAMALGRLNRYNGHTARPYTVAEHSIRMSYLVPEEDAVWALVHDAAEAYIGDIISPVKRLCPELYVMERALLDVICDKLGLPRDMPASVLEADERLLATEARMFLTGDISWAKAEPYPSDNHYAWAPHLGGGLAMFPDAFWMARLQFLLPGMTPLDLDGRPHGSRVMAINSTSKGGLYISPENELRLAQSIGLEHGLERTGHADMVVHLQTYYTIDECRQFAAGLLFGWFWRVIVGRFG